MQAQETVKDRAISKLERDMGDVLRAALNDPKTVEVMLNPDGILWQERLGEPVKQIGTMTPAQAVSMLNTIAGFHKMEVSRSNPILECELPTDGSRFAGQIPPVVPNPSFAIRKKAISVFTLEQYLEAGTMTEEQFAAIKAAVKAHRNILVVGGTGSGKTTLVNAIIQEMTQVCPGERLVIIEDTGEIQCSAPNFVQFHTSGEVSMTDLLKTTLRMRPDRILVGEVRGAEALDLLMAWNSGHEGGAATLHANGAEEGLSKLEMLVSMNPNAPRDIPALVGQVADVVVHIARDSLGRKVRSVIAVERYDATCGKYVFTSTDQSHGGD